MGKPGGPPIWSQGLNLEKLGLNKREIEAIDINYAAMYDPGHSS